MTYQRRAGDIFAFISGFAQVFIGFFVDSGWLGKRRLTVSQGVGKISVEANFLSFVKEIIWSKCDNNN